jgi:hypothetical protein
MCGIVQTVSDLVIKVYLYSSGGASRDIVIEPVLALGIGILICGDLGFLVILWPLTQSYA